MFDEFRLKEVLVDYKRDFLSRWKDEKLLFTTIRKFKGLEAEAVLIVDVSMLKKPFEHRHV